MFKKLFLGIPKKIIILNLIFITIWGVMNSTMTVALAKVTAAKVERKEFLYAALFFVGYIIVWEIVEFLCDCGMGFQGAYVQNATYEYYYRKVYLTKPETLQKENTGYISGILTQLIGRKETLFFSLLLASISLMYIVYLAVYIGIYSIWFSVIVVVLSAAGIAVRLVCSRMIADPLKKMTVARAEQSRIFLDGIQNVSTVQKLRGLSFILKKTKQCGDENLRQTRRYITGNEVGFTGYKLVNYLFCPICMLVAFALYEKNPAFPIVEFMAYTSIVTVQLVHNVKNVAGCVKDYNMYATTQREMDELIADESEVYTGTSIGSAFTNLELKDIAYQYTTKEGAATIRIDHFGICKGERVCITGESGQGKTTLLKLLSGMIETEGKLFIDGREGKKNIDAVYIAQDTEMLDMSLRDNLGLGSEKVTDQEMIDMLGEVGLGEWFITQKDGLDTLLGERGVFVSTGQRQRLNLIRGLLLDKEIYLLDEPTSNVDEITEEKMIRLIQKKLEGKTVIIVTHKEAICKICDKKYYFAGNELSVIDK